MQISRLIELAPKDSDFEGLQPFIFSQTDHLDTQWPEQSDRIMACPFPLFSIEMDGDMGICGDSIEWRGLADVDAMFRCICVRELSPGEYNILALFEIWKDNDRLDDMVIDCSAGQPIDEMLPVIQEMLLRLHTEDNGTTCGTGRVRYRAPDGKKRTFRPRGVIYVGNKKTATSTSCGQVINWNNSWNVMAHWRRLENPESLGIGRDGERNIEGYTWIGHHQKGDGPTVNKIRKVGS